LSKSKKIINIQQIPVNFFPIQPYDFSQFYVLNCNRQILKLLPKALEGI